MSRHPAWSMDYATLSSGLRKAVDEGVVWEKQTGDLRLYCYTPACVYDRRWDDITRSARGLILDATHRRIVATPFPKFFNVGEMDAAIPDLPFETNEKLDGSLIIIFHYDGAWRTATKGSFSSSQAAWASDRLRSHNLTALIPGETYLAEYVGPENKIVISYRDSELVLLGAYDADGVEIGVGRLEEISNSVGWRRPAVYEYGSVSDLLVRAKELPKDEEGFVLRFSDGHRLKVKGDEYRRIHAMISDLSPLSLWDGMQNGNDMTAIRRELPEEFWGDFDQITAILGGKIASLSDDVRRVSEELAHLSDKDVGLRLNSLPENVRPFIFPYRRSGGDLLSSRARRALFRSIRPTANRLDGYTSSLSLNRVVEESR